MKLTSARKPRQPQKRPSGRLRVPAARSRDSANQAAKAALRPILDTCEQKGADSDVLAEALASPDLLAPGRKPRSTEQRLAKFGPAKALSLKIALEGRKLSDADDLVRASKQLGCGSWLQFRKFLEGPQANESKLYAGIHCDQITCPLCQMRRAAKVLQSYHRKVMAIWSEGAPDRRLLFATFTTPDHADPSIAWKIHTTALARLRSTIKDSRKRKNGPFVQLAGGLLSIETKRGKNSGEWHIHSHAVLLNDGRADFAAWQQAWSVAAGFDGAWCKFMHLHSQKALLDGKLRPDQVGEALAKDLCEVLKYPLKFEGQAADLWTVAAVLRRRRRLRPFGCLVGVKLEKSLNDGPVDWSLWPYIELLYKYGGGGQYLLSKLPQ